MIKGALKPAFITIIFALTATSSFAQKRITYPEYIETYKQIAIEHQEVYGIPASIKMAQGLLESDCGNSRLALQANNHFGIKCKKDWTGQSISHDDDEKGECFRKYNSVTESFHDHSEFLDKSPRYQGLFELEVTDYKAWAHGLKAAGYATNPRYADLLIKIIEENQLYLLDSGSTLIADNKTGQVEDAGVPHTDPDVVPADKIDIDNYVVSIRNVSGYQVFYNNGSEFVLARENDSYSRIAGITGVSEKRLRKFNDVGMYSEPAAGEMVYIKAKSKKSNNGKLIHIVTEGETMHSISQTYGIKLTRLTNLNRRSADAKLSTGQQIRLM